MHLNWKWEGNQAGIILGLMLLVDIVLIGLHLVHHFSPFLQDLSWEMTSDRSYAEIFQYIKEFCLVCCFLGLVKIRGDFSYLSLGLLFSYLLVDDSFAVHEVWGSTIANSLQFQDAFGLRAIDFGELAVNAIAGIFFLIVIGLAYRAGNRVFRRVCQRVGVLLLGLAICGIVFDMIHSMFDMLPVLPYVLELLEDGGEMVMMSLLCWYGISLMKPLESSIS